MENAEFKMDKSDNICRLLLTMPEDYNAVITAIEAMNNKR